MGVGWSRPPSLPLRGLRGACAPLRKRPAIHPGQTACNGTRAAFGRPAIHPGQTAGSETHAAFGRRSIPPEPRRCAPLIVALRSEYTRYSSLTRLVSRAPRRPRRSPPAVHRGCSLHHSALFTASLRAAHRCVSVEIHPGQFSRWGLLPHAPCQPDPHRENWASPPPGELASLGAHPGSTTGYYERQANQDRGPRNSRPVDRATGRPAYLSDRTIERIGRLPGGRHYHGPGACPETYGWGGRPYLLFGQTPGR